MAKTELVIDMELNGKVHADGSTSHYAFQPGDAQGSTGRRERAEVWREANCWGQANSG